jgi:hypothetical protein
MYLSQGIRVLKTSIIPQTWPEAGTTGPLRSDEKRLPKGSSTVSQMAFARVFRQSMREAPFPAQS